jgi:hypothetical protein
MGKPALVGGGGVLSGIRTMMMIIRVHVVELLCHAVTGWDPVLKYLVLGACGCL